MMIGPSNHITIIFSIYIAPFFMFMGAEGTIKLPVKSGKDGTGTPCLVTWGMRFQKIGKKRIHWNFKGA